ncbi:MAG TPA: hypothetical protein VEJ20_02775 [Candidatus Eremiobacteraceae bacterium]|nr:hypothetical protein [Candidatus Eremiobacteraceae bacterium]
MAWEEISALAAIVTAAVIAVTAIIAVVQIRHLRAANQLAAAMSLMTEVDQRADARTFVATQLETKMRDPQFRAALASGNIDRHEHLELQLGNYWEKFGLLLRHGLLDKQLFLDWGSQSCLRDWGLMREATRVLRGRSPQVWRDFEYLAHIAAVHLDHIYAHPLQYPAWRESLDAEPDVEPPAR